MPATAASPTLLRALRRTLYPLVRLMLAGGIDFPRFAEFAKGLFVEVAEREFPIPGRPQTDSRISLLSGVHRKDVKRLRQEVHGGHEPPPAITLGATLVAVWTSTAPFADAEGNPLPLPRWASDDPERSFEALVAGVNKDIRSRAVLDEWLRLGVVHLDNDGRVVLDSEAFVPHQGFDEKAYYLGLNVGDHAAATAHNLLGEGRPFLERSVHYDELSPDGVEEMRRLAESGGMRWLKTLNNRAMTLERDDPPASGERQRITCGIYFYAAPVPDAETPPSPAGEAPQ